MTHNSHGSFLENVTSYFDKAAALTNHPRALLDQIKACNSIYAFKSPVCTVRDYEVIPGWRADWR